MGFKTIYLTGAPAAGKSTLTRALTDILDPLAVWEYGARLTEFLKKRSPDIRNQAQLRAQSGNIVTPADIEALDAQLMDWVRDRRESSHLIIDSHPVTKEYYGFRITPFRLSHFEALAPDEIWMLYVPPEVSVARITRDPGGRPMVDLEQSRMHTLLQASVAATGRL